MKANGQIDIYTSVSVTLLSGNLIIFSRINGQTILKIFYKKIRLIQITKHVSFNKCIIQ